MLFKRRCGRHTGALPRAHYHHKSKRAIPTNLAWRKDERPAVIVIK